MKGLLRPEDLARYADAIVKVGLSSFFAGSISSSNGGASWTAQVTLRGPMGVDWFPNTTQGRMFGDYISTSIVGGRAVPVISVATAPTGSTFNQAMNVPTVGLPV